MGDDVQLLFREVADLSPREREQYFDHREVPSDLRAEVESLLLFDVHHAESLTGCVAETATQFLDSDTGPGEGERCGPYELVHLLGRGGMGAVFLAKRTDGEVEQRVAIKFVRNAAEEPAFRDRFLKERQILASLSHPGIARLLDAGHTAGGQPYLVMEYIDGTPIDVYAEALDLRGKLRLFLQVCDAISYAHRNLVIHRDLKPSNILVEAGGQPKLLDFGIARILDEQTDRSLTKELLLTPDYASPEQVRGAAHTTATDVYSLAAVLYRLLTGRSPHTPADGRAESVEVLICLTESTAPSRWTRGLPRDLDFVLAKALRKEPEQRYRGVDELAADVRAVLESRPVQARSGSAWYQARKFLRRQWLPVSAVAAALLSLSIGLYTANREGTIAQHRFDQLRQLANQLLNLDPEIRGLPGSTKARQRVAAMSMEYLEGLGREARNDKDLAMDLAQGYVQLAHVQGVPSYSNLGQFSSADQSLRKADAFLEGVLSADPGRPDALLLSAQIANDRMILADSEHRPGDALAQARRGASRLDALTQGGRASLDQRKPLTRLFSNVAQPYMNMHRLDEAVRYARRAVELARSHSARQDLAGGLSLVANALRQMGDLDGALQAITEARTIGEKTTFTNEAVRVLGLYAILWRQGVILGDVDSISLDRPADAIEPLQAAFDLVERDASRDPNDSTSRARVGTAARQLGAVLGQQDPEQGLIVYDRGLMRQREIKVSVMARRQEARLLAQSSYLLRQLHRDREAKDRIDAAFELLRVTKDYPAAHVELGGEADAAIRALADHEADTGRQERALEIYRDLLDKVMAAKPNPDNDLGQANGLSRIYLSLARLYRNVGNTNEAAKLNARRLDLWRAWDQKLPHNQFVLRQLAASPDRSR